MDTNAEAQQMTVTATARAARVFIRSLMGGCSSGRTGRRSGGLRARAGAVRAGLNLALRCDRCIGRLTGARDPGGGGAGAGPLGWKTVSMRSSRAGPGRMRSPGSWRTMVGLLPSDRDEAAVLERGSPTGMFRLLERILIHESDRFHLRGKR
nr:hypothetical protein GCM10025732_27440 [Glycomyces mayteni]